MIERDVDQPSLGELFKDLAAETGVLVKKEVELATTEMAGKAKTAAKDGGIVAAGGVLGVLATLVLVAALILGLGTVMPLWASALLVGVLFALGAAGLVYVGVNKLKRVDAKPRETIRTLKENKLWLREQMSR